MRSYPPYTVVRTVGPPRGGRWIVGGEAKAEVFLWVRDPDGSWGTPGIEYMGLDDDEQLWDRYPEHEVVAGPRTSVEFCSGIDASGRRWEHDFEAGALYVYIAEPDHLPLRTEELAPGVMVDRDVDGEVVGIEFI